MQQFSFLGDAKLSVTQLWLEMTIVALNMRESKSISIYPRYLRTA
jgi:hypothetical protein